MTTKYHFSFTDHWYSAPLAYWVHVSVPGEPGAYKPAAPVRIPHKGYVVLHIEFEKHELVFSSPAQLEHFIAILAAKPLPSSRYLSARRGEHVGPNAHWLSRLPARLKSPRKREKLVQAMRDVWCRAICAEDIQQFAWREQIELRD